MSYTLKPYTSDQEKIWDQFLEHCKNGHFFFQRKYVEYHNDRFTDASLLVYKDDTLICLLPASIEGATVTTHAGLTFGGFVYTPNMTTARMLLVFEAVLSHYKESGIKRFVYKTSPYIYHLLPADEGLYALFRNHAKLIRRDITSAVALQETTLNSEAPPSQWNIEASTDYSKFWALLEENLATRHQTKPVHSRDEISRLSSLFPANIQLHTCRMNDDLLAGAVLYVNKSIVHVQYMAASETGMNNRALEKLLKVLLKEYQQDPKINYFDFGISNEQQGMYLNKGLITFKEELKAHPVAHDFYEIAID